MNFLPIPKLLQWTPSLSQRYSCTQKILVTSGCSFTSSTLQLATAASWPGYVLDRCRFDQGIDYSYPGAGNEYIGDSILTHFANVPDNEVDQYMVIIMWSGLDRLEDKILGEKMPNLNGVTYQRVKDADPLAPLVLSKQQKIDRTATSANKMFEVFEYLTRRKIAFVFTLYSNLLFPPYVPKRDTTFEFDNFLPKEQLKKLRAWPWIPSQPMDFLYEYMVVNNFGTEDDFHPLAECNLSWTDNILLPGLQKQNLIVDI
jgi:hypothetical protein